MIHFDKINPTSIILWVENTPLYALTYLFQLTEDAISDNNKTELIWDLTKELLIAEYMKKQNHQPNHPLIQEKLKVLQNHEILKELLASQLISENLLQEILTTENLYDQWVKKTLEEIDQEILNNQDSFQQYYEEDPSFLQKNVYELYHCEIPKELDTDSPSLIEIEKTAKTIHHLGTFTWQEIKNSFMPHFKPIEPNNLPKLLRGNQKDHYYYVAHFYEEYKAPYEKIKENFIQFLKEEELKKAIENTALSLMEEEYQIKYNEDVIKALIE